jgi:hypothetical protein
MFNRIGLVLLTVSCTSPFKIFLYLQNQSLYQSSYVSLVELTDRGGGGRGAKSFAIKKAWGSRDCSLFNPLWVNPFENMKKCAKSTHHHVVIGAANTAAPLYSTYWQFSQFWWLCCTNILVQLVLAAPIGENTLTFWKFKNFADFLNVSSTNTLVQYKEYQNVSSTTPTRLKCCLLNQQEWAEKEIELFQDILKFQRKKNVCQHNGS